MNGRQLPNDLILKQHQFYDRSAVREIEKEKEKL
jgi:hypothetical protein